MNEVVEVGTLKFGDWFVSTKGQRGMHLGQTLYYPFNKVYRASVWVRTGQHGLWAQRDWYTKANVIPLPDCTGPDWVAPEPRPEIAIDTPVWVRDSGSHSWHPRHFARWNSDGLIMTYADGYTSHSSPESHDLVDWNYYSLTDPNKDSGNE